MNKSLILLEIITIFYTQR